jgi:hypothetical protein
MKKIIYLIIILLPCYLFAQIDNGVETHFKANIIKNKNEKLAVYITNLYNHTPFEGVKIIDEKNTSYLVSLSIQAESSHKTTSTKNRIAQIKARRNAMVFLSGSTITSESIIKTGETITDNSVSYYETYFDEIKENSAGFLEGMQVLTTFKSSNGKEYIYVIYKKL